MTMRNEMEREYKNKITLLKNEIRNVDAVMIGAGAGLSTAAGFRYDGERFQKYFSEFEEKYHFHDMYSGGFYEYETLEEYWAYWSRYIYINRYLDAPLPVYQQLFDLVCKKDYFVLTTNVDHCFQKAGFEKERLFYTQGDYGLFQCSKPCCMETFDNEIMILDMVKQQKNMRIPVNLIPRCPHCGGLLIPNLRADDKFVQDAGWEQAARRYERFEQSHKKMKTLYLEIGVGYNTPGIIKYNFWQQVEENENAVYVCLNMNSADAPVGIKERSICIAGDSSKVIEDLMN